MVVRLVWGLRAERTKDQRFKMGRCYPYIHREDGDIYFGDRNRSDFKTCYIYKVRKSKLGILELTFQPPIPIFLALFKYPLVTRSVTASHFGDILIVG